MSQIRTTPPPPKKKEKFSGLTKSAPSFTLKRICLIYSEPLTEKNVHWNPALHRRHTREKADSIHSNFISEGLIGLQLKITTVTADQSLYREKRCLFFSRQCSTLKHFAHVFGKQRKRFPRDSSIHKK